MKRQTFSRRINKIIRENDAENKRQLDMLWDKLIEYSHDEKDLDKLFEVMNQIAEFKEKIGF